MPQLFFGLILLFTYNKKEELLNDEFLKQFKTGDV
tara:strand:+ start:26290 stop:26394 length:105 start_codon:yes stop_codon:yes gene_type:complete